MLILNLEPKGQTEMQVFLSPGQEVATILITKLLKQKLCLLNLFF